MGRDVEMPVEVPGNSAFHKEKYRSPLVNGFMEEQWQFKRGDTQLGGFERKEHYLGLQGCYLKDLAFGLE